MKYMFRTGLRMIPGMQHWKLPKKFGQVQQVNLNYILISSCFFVFFVSSW